MFLINPSTFSFIWNLWVRSKNDLYIIIRFDQYLLDPVISYLYIKCDGWWRYFVLATSLRCLLLIFSWGKSPTQNFHHHKVTNIPLSPIALSPVSRRPHGTTVFNFRSISYDFRYREKKHTFHDWKLMRL